jgi:hypothetical protein
VALPSSSSKPQRSGRGAISAGSEQRILHAFGAHYPPTLVDECELRYNFEGVSMMVDHALDLELVLVPAANAALLTL